MDGCIYDVIIVGGGPAGCATALSLSKHNQHASFLVIDDADPSSFKIGESLPPESSNLLHRLHPTLPTTLANDITSGTHLLCTGNSSAWASSVLEERHAIMNPFGHGFHLDRMAFDESLRCSVVDACAKSRSLGGGTCVVKGAFKRIEKTSDGISAVHVLIDGQETSFLAKWVVDATGRKASLATKLGAKIITSNPLLAFYALFNGPSPQVTPDADNDHNTLIEATPSGWWYSALLSQHPTTTRIVAFHTLPTHPSAKLARRHDGFLDLLHSSSPHISSIIKTNGYDIAPGGGFPRCTAAGSTHVDKVYGLEDRWVAVGDAAMAFDPLSSQGMMTALEMGYFVGMVLATTILADGEIKTEQALAGVEEVYRRVRKEYEQHRAYYYGCVKRFGDEVFWRNVHNDR